MYQTIGHALIPLYAQALGIPLYRAPIIGAASNTDRIYHYAPVQESYRIAGSDPYTSTSQSGTYLTNSTQSSTSEDETEALIPLLTHILNLHPSANALSTGAILSTYQRSRVESIATRLNLTSLAYLWQYPILPPYTQTSLLHDISAVGQDSCLLYTSPSPRDGLLSRMPSSA